MKVGVLNRSWDKIISEETQLDIIQYNLMREIKRSHWKKQLEVVAASEVMTDNVSMTIADSWHLWADLFYVEQVG